MIKQSTFFIYIKAKEYTFFKFFFNVSYDSVTHVNWHFI